jgi:pyridoxal phosphate enzyme (YggS family)
MVVELRSLIQFRYNQVLERIQKAATVAGRNPDNIHLVVVTKAQPLQVIQSLIELGVQNIGENYVEEALSKKAALESPDILSWHMIGHIQSRKASLVSKEFDYVHSLDSIKLAEHLNRAATEANRLLPVFLECNVSGEETKFGWQCWEKAKWPELEDAVQKFRKLPALKICGLMTMAPYTENPEESRSYFKRLAQLRDYLSAQAPHENWSELSMGMSADFEVAIHEGATWIRIGQAILGPRSGK